MSFLRTLTRYLRLYGFFLRFSWSKALEFRIDFFFRIVMDVIFYAVNIAFFQILFQHTSWIANWSEPQVMIFVASFLMIDALNMTFFSNNTWFFPQMVNKGDFDYLLIRPVSSFFFVSFREFAANSFVNVLIASGILAWAILRYPEPLGFFKILFFLILILNGLMIYHLIHMVTLMTVFWTHSANGVARLFWSFDQFVERPDRIYKGITRTVLTTILPFALVASFPVRLFLEPFDLSLFLHLGGVTVLLASFVKLLWNQGLRSYSSASS